MKNRRRKPSYLPKSRNKVVANKSWLTVILFLVYLLTSVFLYIETWMLFRGYKKGVSKIVLDAYRNYEVMELKKFEEEIPINDRRRQVKLISIAGKNVNYCLSVCLSIWVKNQ